MVRWNLERGVWYVVPVAIASVVAGEMKVSEKESEPETNEDLENIADPLVMHRL